LHQFAISLRVSFLTTLIVEARLFSDQLAVTAGKRTISR
jgi:hypothetical protein